VNPNTLLLPTVWPRAEPTTVARCVLLAMLAHVWLVLTLGNAPGGTAQPGEGVWGAVNVTLRGPATPGAVDLPTPPEPAVATGPVGLAETPRWGGAVRSQTAPEVPPEPGAAQLGRWAPLPAPAPAAEPALTPLPRAPVLQPAFPAGPLPEPGRVLEERAVPPPPERTMASSLTRPLAPTAPLAPALSAMAPIAPLPGRLPDLAAPAAAPLMAPRAAPPPPTAPVAALPSTQPAAAPVVVTGPAPPALSSLVAPVAPVAPAVALSPAVPAAAAAVAAPAVAAASVLPPAASPVTAALPSGGAPAGLADAGTRLGHDVAGAPALPASAPPRLNLQLARQRGGEISRGLGGGVLAVLPRPPEVDDKLGQQIAKTAKVDCRSAYAGAGVLAVVPLVAESLRKDSSCKW
jgi:Meckel syndrome type 1 protein